MTRRLLINGCFGYRNLGDEAILTALAHRAKRVPGLEPVAISGDPEETRARHGINAVLRTRISPFRPWRPRSYVDFVRLFSMVRTCNAAILGGGGVLVDAFRDDVANYLDPLRLAQAMSRTSAAFCVGGEHLVSPASRKRVREVLGRAEFVSVRDKRTQALLIESGLPEDRVFLGADPALELADMLRPSPADSSERSMVLMMPCAYLGQNHEEDAKRRAFWTATAGELVRTGRLVRLIPLSPRDARWFEGLRDGLRNHEVQLDSQVPDMETLLDLMRCSDLVIAEKLHGAVLALSVGVPPLMLAYRLKVQALAEEAGLIEWAFSAGHGELLPFDLPEVAAVATAASGILRDLPAARRRVRDSVRQLRNRLDEAYVRMWSALSLAE